MTKLIQETGYIDIDQFQKDNLQGFSGVTLEQMKRVNLMDRIDRKYIFPSTLLPGILSEMKEEYGVLSIKNTHYSHLESVYLDTPDYKFYMQHHNGKLNRYKIRYREYENTALRFLETKFKTNKGRTKKQRILQEASSGIALGEEERNFIAGIVPVNPDKLSAKICIRFTRLNFLNLHKPERLTIDLNLSFEHKEWKISYPEVVIAELKQSKFDSSSLFSGIMKKHSIRISPFSKYCIGMSHMHNIKSNSFKKLLLNLKKIRHQYDTA